MEKGFARTAPALSFAMQEYYEYLLVVHPAADVYAQLTGRDPGKPTTIELRDLIAEHARAAGVRHVSTTASCTRCNNDQFFSHRAGDTGRQLGVMIADIA